MSTEAMSVLIFILAGAFALFASYFIIRLAVRHAIQDVMKPPVQSPASPEAEAHAAREAAFFDKMQKP